MDGIASVADAMAEVSVADRRCSLDVNPERALWRYRRFEFL